MTITKKAGDIALPVMVFRFVLDLEKNPVFIPYQGKKDSPGTGFLPLFPPDVKKRHREAYLYKKNPCTHGYTYLQCFWEEGF